MRATWVPADQAARDRCVRSKILPPAPCPWRLPSSTHSIDATHARRLEAEHGIVVRFVIGHSPAAAAEAAVDEEERLHGGFLRLPLTEAYASLPTKTLLFLRVCDAAAAAAAPLGPGCSPQAAEAAARQAPDRPRAHRCACCALLQAATQLYDAQYIVKADDDVYLRLDRLPHAVAQWGSIHAGTGRGSRRAAVPLAASPPLA